MKICSFGFQIPFPDYFSSKPGLNHLKTLLDQSKDYVTMGVYEMIIDKVQDNIPLTCLDFPPEIHFPENVDNDYVIHDSVDRCVRVVYPDNLEGKTFWEIEKIFESYDEQINQDLFYQSSLYQRSLYDIAIEHGYRGSDQERHFPKLMSWKKI